MTGSAVLTERWSRWRQRVDDCLEQHLPAAGTEPAMLHDAMRYAVVGTGKRFRAARVYATGEGLGATPTELDLPACAVELVHAFSLCTMTYLLWMMMIFAAGNRVAMSPLVKPQRS